jgi:hypothetical protein
MSPHVVIAFWNVVAIVAVCAIIFRFLGERSRNRLFQSLVEKGQPLPPDLMRETPRAWDPRGFVVAGILLLALGVATALFGLAVSSGLAWDDAASSGGPSRMVMLLSLFPFCLGGACLLIGRLLKTNG